MEHVRRLRLERAAHRLKFTGQPVTRIAFDAGYETLEAFSRAFRAMFDDSPSGFREAHQALPFRAAPSGVHFAPGGKVEDFRTAPGSEPLVVRLKRVAPLRVAFIRHVGPYAEAGPAWGRLLSWAGRQGLLRGKPTLLGIVHDDPDVTPPEKIRYDACLAVDGAARAQGEVGVQEIAGGEFAVTTHRGPYDRLSETYAQLLGQWLPFSGREPGPAPGFEAYRNAPGETPPPELLTDIYLPLAER